MDNKSDKIAAKYLGYGVLLSLVMGIVAFAPIWLPNEGRFMEYGDYYPQYIPFLLEMKRMVQSGSLAWSWNSFLGDSFISAYSYYTAFNPFAWLVIAFPEEIILYATMFAALLKLAVGTVGAMLYLKMFTKRDSWVLLGGLLYTFSSFSVINTNFYFFQEVITFFPYLMYGLECLIQKKKHRFYIGALVINAIINFYFFVSTVFLVVFYVVLRLELYRPRGWKNHFVIFLHIALCSILGVGLAGFALVPSLYAILGSGKAAASFGNAGYIKVFEPADILERLRVLVAPIDSNTYHSFYNSSSWCSVAAFLPVFGCLFGLHWCRRKCDWLQKLLILLFICYLLPIPNSLFNLFTSAHYSRWLYGPVLWLALVTVRSLEDWEESGKNVSAKCLAAYILAAAALTVVPAAWTLFYRFGLVPGWGVSAGESEYYFGNRNVVILTGLTLENLGLLWSLLRSKKPDFRKIIIWVCLAGTVNYCVFNQLNYDPYYVSHYQKTLVEGTHREDLTYSYRIDHPNEIMNYSLFQNEPAVHNYNSMQNLGSTRFAIGSGFISHMKTVFLAVPEASRSELDALLSVRYFMDYDRTGKVPEGFVYSHSENGVDVYENSNYLPMGFTYSSYVLESDLEELEPAQRSQVMLGALVIGEADEAAAAAVLDKAQQIPQWKTLEAAVEDRRENVCSHFKGTSEGFQAEITLPEKNVVFFSVPMDDGWMVTVNGEPAELVQVHYGLMGVLCDEGANTIEAVYHTRGMAAGFGCSALFALLWLVWEWFSGKKKLK